MKIKTIKETITNTIIIDKSRFITYLYPIDSKKDIDRLLEEARKQYFDATHICYGTILKENGVLFYKSSDDGEPSSTAGAPILNVLKKNELENVLCIVIRYFGGIKLGAGGLVRAYGGSCSEILKMASIVTKVEKEIYEIKANYNQERLLSNALKKMDAIIHSKEFEMEVIFKVTFKNENDLPSLIKLFANQLLVTQIDTTFIEQ